jgi:hypothetical protein
MLLQKRARGRSSRQMIKQKRGDGVYGLMEGDDLKWQCRCGGVILLLRGNPLFDVDCHCTHCLPVAQYVLSKGISLKNAGISAVCATGHGVAKSFYSLDCVSVYRGREHLQLVKRAVTRTNSSADH